MDEPIPSEFSQFIRTVARRAFDRVAEDPKELETALRPVVRAWTKLTGREKDALITALIGAAPKPARKTGKPVTPRTRSSTPRTAR